MAGTGLRPRLREFDNPWPKRHKIGKTLRERTPRESHADGKPAANRPDPLDLLAASNVGRRKDLIPLRMGRMAASPFTFLRGAACVMAWDLSKTPNSGISVVIAGDAHINNFGMYGTPQRDVIFDLNDFDEATIGPWEWDLKRLVASVNVAARENGMNKAERASAVMRPSPAIAGTCRSAWRAWACSIPGTCTSIPTPRARCSNETRRPRP